MPKVKGPNGSVVEVPEVVASGLVGDGSRGYEYVRDESKKTTSKSSSKK